MQKEQMSVARLLSLGAVLLLLPVCVLADTTGAEDSILILDSLIKKSPSDFVAHLSLGELYMRMGIFKESERFLRQARQLLPTSPKVNYLLGENSVRSNKISDAVVYLEECVRLDSSYVPALASLAEITLMAHKDTASAARYYNAILSYEPAHKQALQNLAVILQKRGENEKAVSMLEKYVANYPDSGNGMINLGILYATTGRFHEAFVQFSEASRKDKYVANALYCLGTLFFTQSAYEKAAEYFEKLFEGNGSIEAGIGLAVSKYKDGKLESALGVLSIMTVNAKKSSERYMYLLMGAEMSLFADNFERAIEYCKQAHEEKEGAHIEQVLLNTIGGKTADNGMPKLHRLKQKETAEYEAGGLLRTCIQGIGFTEK